MNIYASGCTLISAILISGCIPDKAFPINESKPVVEMQRDYGRCADSAERKYPVRMDSYETDPSFEPITTSCTSYSGLSTYTTSCTSSGGYVPSKTRWYDANESNRIKYEMQCLASQGYKQKNIPYCSSKVPNGAPCWTDVEITGATNLADMQIHSVLTISNGKLYSWSGKKSCLGQNTCTALWGN